MRKWLPELLIGFIPVLLVFLAFIASGSTVAPQRDESE